MLGTTLEPGLLKRLDRLRITVRSSLASRPGNVPVHGATQPSGLEVSRYRPYAQGDDLRHLDWNVYARLDQLVVKLFRAEREAPLQVVLDTTASMGVPPADGKFDFARALALSLVYVSAHQNDPASVVVITGGRRAHTVSPICRHQKQLPRIQAFLDSLQPHGATTLAQGVGSYLRTTRQPGVSIVVSDFLTEPGDYQAALDQLRTHVGTVAVVRVLGPAERDLQGLPPHVRLRDAESGAERQVTINADNLARYRQAVRQHTDTLRSWCAGRSIACAVVDPTAGLETAVVGDLPRAGILQV